LLDERRSLVTLLTVTNATAIELVDAMPPVSHMATKRAIPDLSNARPFLIDVVRVSVVRFGVGRVLLAR
jgi:hypothetical protein